MKLNIQYFGGRGASSGNTATLSRPSLGTINGEEIRSFELVGDESGDYGKEFTSLKDLYEAMQDTKSMDRREFGYTDTYTVTVNTDNNAYIGYKISKYKGRYRLK